MSDPEALPDPVSWVRERDIDLVLAESFTVMPTFTDWVIPQIAGVPWKPEPVLSSDAIVSHHRRDAAPRTAGETDVLVQVCWSGGAEALLSVENKVLASAQKLQGSRHRRFVEDQPIKPAAAVLIAPQTWIDSHAAEVGEYHGAVSIEGIAAWHADQPSAGARWRGRVLAQAARQRRTLDAAPDLDAWCLDLAGAISRFGLRLEPQKRQRVPNRSGGKPGRFIWVRPTPSLISTTGR